jgi:hypothetical protein
MCFDLLCVCGVWVWRVMKPDQQECFYSFGCAVLAYQFQEQ